MDVALENLTQLILLWGIQGKWEEEMGHAHN